MHGDTNDLLQLSRICLIAYTELSVTLRLKIPMFTTILDVRTKGSVLIASDPLSLDHISRSFKAYHEMKESDRKLSAWCPDSKRILDSVTEMSPQSYYRI